MKIFGAVATGMWCAVALVASVVCANAEAKSGAVNIRCHRADLVEGDVVISQLWSDSFKVMMYCVDANFVSDVTPCAPNHGYSESSVIGAANIVKIGYGADFPYLADNIALHVEASDPSIVFSATKANFDSLISVWRFNIDMENHAGIAEIDGRTVEYVCSKA